ncbi:hypothetical protein [Shewanella surugensis]|uniref:Uncharacterized protein n=1 Tax=Shewanella surugensis TaxID=212020 RepID=A0ABT0LJ59_9GAMM|nr:hypothetical protein [Shewanella surugensis]MCL1127721.1 hypothetical protein [Shewanella surugensis]
MTSITLATIPANQLTESTYNTEGKEYSQLNLSNNRIYAAINGDVKAATDMGFFDTLFDKIFNSSQKAEALDLLKTMIENELTTPHHQADGRYDESLTEYHSLKNNFDALKSLAGEHNKGLFVIENEGSLEDISVVFTVAGQPIRSALNPNYVYDDRQDILDGFGSYSEEGDALISSNVFANEFV